MVNDRIVWINSGEGQRISRGVNVLFLFLFFKFRDILKKKKNIFACVREREREKLNMN